MIKVDTLDDIYKRISKLGTCGHKTVYPGCNGYVIKFNNNIWNLRYEFKYTEVLDLDVNETIICGLCVNEILNFINKLPQPN